MQMEEEFAPLAGKQLGFAVRRRLREALLTQLRLLPGLITKCAQGREEVATAVAQPEPPPPPRQQSDDEIAALRSELLDKVQKLEQAEHRSAALAAAARRQDQLAQRGDLLRTIDVPPGCPAHEWTYERLFLRFSSWATEAILREPYLVSHDQMKSFAQLLQELCQCTRVRELHLITHVRSQRQEQRLRTVARHAKQHLQLNLTWQFDADLHDRELFYAGVGVVVTCDRGLDVFGRRRGGVWRTRTCKLRCYELSPETAKQIPAQTADESAPATPARAPIASLFRSRTPEKIRQSPVSDGLAMAALAKGCVSSSTTPTVPATPQRPSAADEYSIAQSTMVRPTTRATASAALRAMQQVCPLPDLLAHLWIFGRSVEEIECGGLDSIHPATAKRWVEDQWQDILDNDAATWDSFRAFLDESDVWTSRLLPLLEATRRSYTHMRHDQCFVGIASPPPPTSTL